MDIDTLCILKNGCLQLNRIHPVDRQQVIQNSNFPEELSFLYKRFDTLNNLFFKGIIPETEISFSPLHTVDKMSVTACTHYDVTDKGLQKPWIRFSNLMIALNGSSERNMIFSDLLLHEMVHQFCSITHSEQEKNCHGAAYRKECCRISEICGWPLAYSNKEIKRNRRERQGLKPDHWPHHQRARIDRRYAVEYSFFASRFDEAVKKIRTEELQRKAYRLKPETEQFVSDLVDRGLEDEADKYGK